MNSDVTHSFMHDWVDGEYCFVQCDCLKVIVAKSYPELHQKYEDHYFQYIASGGRFTDVFSF